VKFWARIIRHFLTLRSCTQQPTETALVRGQFGSPRVSSATLFTVNSRKQPAADVCSRLPVKCGRADADVRRVKCGEILQNLSVHAMGMVRVSRHFGPRTLRTQDISVRPKCLSALVPNCPGQIFQIGTVRYTEGL